MVATGGASYASTTHWRTGVTQAQLDQIEIAKLNPRKQNGAWDSWKRSIYDGMEHVGLKPLVEQPMFNNTQDIKGALLAETQRLRPEARTGATITEQQLSAARDENERLRRELAAARAEVNAARDRRATQQSAIFAQEPTPKPLPPAANQLVKANDACEKRIGELEEKDASVANAVRAIRNAALSGLGAAVRSLVSKVPYDSKFAITAYSIAAVSIATRYKHTLVPAAKAAVAKFLSVLYSVVTTLARDGAVTAMATGRVAIISSLYAMIAALQGAPAAPAASPVAMPPVSTAPALVPGAGAASGGVPSSTTPIESGGAALLDEGRLTVMGEHASLYVGKVHYGLSYGPLDASVRRKPVSDVGDTLRSSRGKIPHTAGPGPRLAVGDDNVLHEYIGQRVTRVFEQYGVVSTGVINRWLPPDEQAGDGALFHVLHDGDGDEEDLDEDEAAAAIAQHAEHVRNGTLPEVKKREFVYDNWYEAKRHRLAPAALGAVGLRDELLALEEALLPGLKRNGSPWDSHDGGRMPWLLSAKSSTHVPELAQLLGALEESVHSVQIAVDVVERKPWRTDGHPLIGRSARRFFAAGDGTSFASDGKIVGWLPAEGDDETLWHMVHGEDADEEDLDEKEAHFAMANFVEGRSEMTPDEAEYAAAYAAEQAAKAAEGGEGEEDEPEDDDNVHDVPTTHLFALRLSGASGTCYDNSTVFDFINEDAVSDETGMTIQKMGDG